MAGPLQPVRSNLAQTFALGTLLVFTLSISL